MIPVAEGVAVELPGSGGGRHYAISRSGSLVYVPAADAYELVVVGANAVERVVGQPQRSLENRVYADHSGPRKARRGSGGRNAVMILSFRYSSSR